MAADGKGKDAQGADAGADLQVEYMCVEAISTRSSFAAMKVSLLCHFVAVADGAPGGRDSCTGKDESIERGSPSQTEEDPDRGRHKVYSAKGM